MDKTSAKCIKCNGTLKIKHIGFMFIDCKACGGTGYEKAPAALIEGNSHNKEDYITNDANKERVKKRRGRPPREKMAAHE